MSSWCCSWCRFNPVYRCCCCCFCCCCCCCCCVCTWEGALWSRDGCLMWLWWSSFFRVPFHSRRAQNLKSNTLKRDWRWVCHLPAKLRSRVHTQCVIHSPTHARTHVCSCCCCCCCINNRSCCRSPSWRQQCGRGWGFGEERDHHIHFRTGFLSYLPNLGFQSTSLSAR